MARKKVGPFGAVERYKEEMAKPERVRNYETGIRGYLADTEALNLTKYKLLLYQLALRKKSADISKIINDAVGDYVKALGNIPRHRKQLKAFELVATQHPTVKASVDAVAKALEALATLPSV
jgi:hypothetical protein